MREAMISFNQSFRSPVDVVLKRGCFRQQPIFRLICDPEDQGEGYALLWIFCWDNTPTREELGVALMEFLPLKEKLI